MMRQPLLLLEFNEINFEHVTYYAERGLLPNLHAMLGRSGLTQTTSEKSYEDLEPWIQWVTAHTGQTLAEHQVFRLGDIVQHDIPQIWERLEAQGLKVGAISPMNAKHRLRHPAFFVPDPWTATDITAPPTLRALYRVVAQAVNENAQARMTLPGIARLLAGWLRYASPRNYSRYLGLGASAYSRPWRRAMFLDLLLADVFVREVARTRPDFATFFLNAGAHIQHHYMFCAAAYQGPLRNPSWYIRAGLDPVRDVYELYDHILGSVRRAFPEARIMIATGLHQVPHPKLTYYWRLKDHGAFLQSIGVPFERVEPRMSRDFLLICRDAQSASFAAERLRGAVAADGESLFEIDNRGTDLFVMLSYAGPIEPGFRFSIAQETFDHLPASVVFVALKNGEHNGVGYLLDSAVTAANAPSEMRLAELPALIMSALGAAQVQEMR